MSRKEPCLCSLCFPLRARRWIARLKRIDVTDGAIDGPDFDRPIERLMREVHAEVAIRNPLGGPAVELLETLLALNGLLANIGVEDAAEEQAKAMHALENAAELDETCLDDSDGGWRQNACKRPPEKMIRQAEEWKARDRRGRLPEPEFESIPMSTNRRSQ